MKRINPRRPLLSKPGRPYWAILALVPLVLALLLASLALGSVPIPLGEVLSILQGGETSNPAWRTIVLQFRFPRALTALAAGAALGLSGLQLQALFRNPLAGPSLLGINAGASLGAALVVLMGARIPPGWLTQLGVVGAANLGAGATMAIVVLVAQRLRNPLALLLFGLMFGYTVSAIVTVLLHFSSLEQTQAYVVWTFGSFAGVTWERLPLLLGLVVIGIGASGFLGRSLNLLLLGEDQAVGLGLNLKQLRVGLIILASLLAGTVTAYCGPIAFIGVAVPHLCRQLFRTVDHRLLTPGVALVGAGLALLADGIAQLPGSQSLLPLNAVTALLGGPIIASLILQQSRRR
ncbi:MAG: iron ABC transporter permease [Synechococcales cyanobacterium RM1_1_8]|nr:iron ABC transporter permease [Synechococcales cyanobacterium RM1_1_8]